MQRGTPGEPIPRELLSWTLGFAVAAGAVVAMVILMAELDPSLRRALEVLFLVGPWIAVWVLSRVPLFALFLWTVPAVVIVALVYVSAPPLIFHGVVCAVGLAAALICVSTHAYGLVDRPRAALQTWIVARSMRRAARRAYEELRRAARPTSEERRAMEQEIDPVATARAFRASAERVLAVDAPDETWRRVVNAVAQPGLAYAEMLEQRRALDYEVLAELVRRRNEALDTALRQSSWTYGWLTFPRSAAVR